MWNHSHCYLKNHQRARRTECRWSWSMMKQLRLSQAASHASACSLCISAAFSSPLPGRLALLCLLCFAKPQHFLAIFLQSHQHRQENWARSQYEKGNRATGTFVETPTLPKNQSKYKTCSCSPGAATFSRIASWGNVASFLLAVFLFTGYHSMCLWTISTILSFPSRFAWFENHPPWSLLTR